MTKTAAIYARYSSDEQKDSSIADQIADCMEIARREGYKVAKQFIFEDRAISGTSRFGRTGMDSLIDAVRARKFDVLLCESQSRLARDVEDFAFLSKRLLSNEIILHTYHDGLVPLDDMMGSIRSAIDAQYSKTLSKNVKQGMRGRARLGLRPGQLTYGYKLVEGGRPGEWEIDPEKAKIVRRIFREYVAEVSVRDIAVGLTRDKIPTPKKRGGTAWGHQAFLGGGDGGILSNRLYAGESVYGKQYFVKDHDTHKTSKRWRPESEWIVTPVPHLQIIDSKTWDAAQRLRASRQPLKVSGEVVIRQTVIRNKGHLLSGLLGCGKCGGKMISSNVSRGRTYVKCASAHLKTACDHRRAYDIDKLKKIVVDNYCADDPEFEARMRRAYNLQFSKSARRDNDDERAEVEGQIAKLKIQQARIADLIIDGDIDIDVADLKEKLKAKEVLRVGLVERLRRLGGENVIQLPNAFDAYLKNVKNMQRRLVEEIDDPSEALRLAFRNVMDSIVIQPSVRGEPYVVDAYGHFAAGEIDLFPEPRTVGEIVAAEGIPTAAIASRKVTPY